MKDVQLFLITILCTFIISCSSSNENKFIGKWIEIGKENVYPTEIYKQGNQLYFKLTKGNESMEFPAKYNNENQSLSLEIGSQKVNITYIPEVDHIRANFIGESTEFKKLNEQEALYLTKQLNEKRQRDSIERVNAKKESENIDWSKRDKEKADRIFKK